MKTARFDHGSIDPNPKISRCQCRDRLSAAGIVLAIAAVLTALAAGATAAVVLQGTPTAVDTAAQVVETFALSTLSLQPSGSPDRLRPGLDPRVDLRYSPGLPITDPAPSSLLLPRPQNP